MNHLQQPDATEKLVAQGKYNYQVADKFSGLTEQWSLHHLPDGRLVHRAEVKGAIADITLNQLSHLVMSADHQPQELMMSQRVSDNWAETYLKCQPQQIIQAITIEGKTTETVIEVPANYSLFLPPVSAHGFILRQYDFPVGGKQKLPLASVRMQPQGDLSLSIEVIPITYEYLNDEEIETPAGQFACQQFMRYDQHMEQRLWLDQTNTVIQWNVPYSPIMKWNYLLVQYQRETS